jgi:hypothetical protein
MKCQSSCLNYLISSAPSRLNYFPCIRVMLILLYAWKLWSSWMLPINMAVIELPDAMTVNCMLRNTPLHRPLHSCRNLCAVDAFWYRSWSDQESGTKSCCRRYQQTSHVQRLYLWLQNVGSLTQVDFTVYLYVVRRPMEFGPDRQILQLLLSAVNMVITVERGMSAKGRPTKRSVKVSLLRLVLRRKWPRSVYRDRHTLSAPHCWHSASSRCNEQIVWYWS